jgi:hypothetical protein
MTGLIANGLMLLKWNSAHDVSSVTSTRRTELHLPANLCSGGKAIAHLKVMAYVSPNLL